MSEAADHASSADAAPLVIAIDGPAGAGKSTVGRALAERLSIGYLDTGAMYRAMTYAALHRGVVEGDLDEVAAMAPTVELAIEGDHVIVDGIDATLAIRGREVTEAVSQVAANPAVREVLVQRQRAWVDEHGGGVVEGRDIGIGRVPRCPAQALHHGLGAGAGRTSGRRHRRRRR